MTIPTEPGVPMPCGLYPECKDECTWPDCVQDEENAAEAFRAAVQHVEDDPTEAPYDVEAGWARLMEALDLRCPEPPAAPNRATRRLKQFRPNRKERPPWTAADRTTPMPSSPRQR